MNEEDKNKLIGRGIAFFGKWDVTAIILDVIGCHFKLKIVHSSEGKYYTSGDIVLFPYNNGNVFKFIDNIDDE